MNFRIRKSAGICRYSACTTLRNQTVSQLRLTLQQFRGLSLNDVLLKGPPSCNGLLGILMRFRKGVVAVTIDVEQMFYNFKVDENYRDYLRFICHKDNDLSKPLVDHRMTVHVFDNSPSSAVAMYGIRNMNRDFYNNVLRCIHHFKSDLVYNMDHMRISGIEPSSVILSQRK